ncbi:GNAT family N-acetyltransferase [Sphingobium vermicomposti]|uniref:CelD/BcsL family acetyltransferase involved in cellulose biosynthesis n=1 Tax=Sphingobium vermicomposti TaxID=529005 RepID=A0A846MG04_9SPHN|nr:GNAT family N-acetyltransferase [Sphingobium vermicomposti]NIJ15646.1 CelD/BcsL family acetyltransferase involved in cellulose biosynthesis [Sphingobium vermicomposti]
MSMLPAASAFQPSHEWPMVDAERPIVRMLRHADLTADDRACWAGLSAQAGAANVFAQDWFMDAALSHATDGRDTLLAVVSLGHGPWLGVMPLVAELRFGRWPARIWRNWSATNQFLGTPLVAAQTADIFWDALLAFLDRRAGTEILLHFQGFDADDPVSTALFDRCGQEGRGLHIIQCLDRPAYRAGDDAAGRCDSKMRGRLRSLSRRLERDHGSVVVTLLDPDQPCAPWIDAFLKMEASGWKGRIGSALGSQSATETLFRTVIERGHANGSARLATLSVGGRAIAMSSWFESTSWGHGFKMAFDEDYRAYAPGQLLMHDISERIGRRPDMSFDTCVPRDANSSHRLWRSSRRIIDGAVAIGSPWHRFRFDALIKARAAYAAVRNHFSTR